MKKENGTSTSSFGTSGRVNHDSSKFYNSKLYCKAILIADARVSRGELLRSLRLIKEEIALDDYFSAI